MKKFLQNESGGVTVEFVLWLPVLLGFLLLATDASYAFMRQSQMYQVSRETARIVSRYGLDETEAETYAAAQATMGGYSPTVDVSFSAGDVIVLMEMPSGAISPLGVFNFAISDKIKVAVTHAMEPI